MGTLQAITLKKDYKNGDLLDYLIWNSDQQAIEKVINKLIGSIEAGDSGADNIGVTPILAGCPSNAQGAFKWIYDKLIEVAQTGIADNSISDVKLAQKDIQLVTDTLTKAFSFSNIDTNMAIMGLKGKSVINQFDGGDCESISGFVTAAGGTLTLDSSNKVSGNYGIKVIQAAAALWTSTGKDISNRIDKSKYWCLSGYLKNGNLGNISLTFQQSNGTAVKSSSAVTDTSKFTRAFVKIQPSDLINVIYAGVSTSTPSVGANYGYFDLLMLNELTVDEYNDANYVPPEWVANNADANGIVVMSRGKNIFDGANYKIASLINNDDGSITIPAALAANWFYATAVIPVKKNTNYTISSDVAPTYGRFTIGTESSLNLRDNISARALSPTGSLKKTTFNTGNNEQIAINYVSDDGKDTSTASFTIKIQIEEGSTNTTIESGNIESRAFPFTLRQIKNVVQDEITQDGQSIQRVYYQVLDSTLSYLLHSDGAGFKVIKAVLAAVGVNGSAIVQNNNNKMLTPGTVGQALTAADKQILDTNGTTIYISIADSDSGWGETYSPTEAERLACILGYKMNNGVYGTNYDGTGTKTWIPWNATNNTGAVTTCPTTVAANWKYYRLYYKLATENKINISPIMLWIPSNGSIGIDSTIRPYVNYTWYKNLKAMLGAIIFALASTINSVNVKKEYGTSTYSDSVAANSYLTKLIPIGNDKQFGRAIIANASTPVYSILVNFDADKSHAKVVGAYGDSASYYSIGSAWSPNIYSNSQTPIALGTVDTSPTGKKYGTECTGSPYIGISLIRIVGSNIEITFKNVDESTAYSLNCIVDWEAW